MILKLSWRNIWRNKRRSLLTCLSIAFGLWMAIITTSIGNYSYSAMIDSNASMGFGHVTIQAPGYNLNPSTKKTISGTKELLRQVESYELVKKASIRIMGNAMVASASKNTGAQFVAVRPDDVPTDNLIRKSIVQGEFLSSESGRDVVIGTDMAKKLGLKLGRKLVYTSTDINGDMTSSLLRVKGIFDTGATEINSFVIMIPIENAREALGYSKDQATMLAIELDDNRETNSFRDLLEGKVGRDGIVVTTWDKTQPDLADFVAIDRGTSRIFLVMICVLIALGVLNTLLMNVMERRHEFGIMLAVGMSPGLLIRSILVESALLGVVGFALGAVFTYPTHYFFVNVGWDISGLMGEGTTAGGAVMDTVIRSVIYPENIVFIILALAVLIMGSAFYPAYKASKVAPVEAIGGHN